jgi:hypothetical protein
VIISYERGRKVAVLTPRSEAEPKALKALEMIDRSARFPSWPHEQNAD